MSKALYLKRLSNQNLFGLTKINVLELDTQHGQKNTKRVYSSLHFLFLVTEDLAIGLPNID